MLPEVRELRVDCFVVLLVLLALVPVPVDVPLFPADCFSFFLADRFFEVPEERVVLFLSELMELLVEDLAELLSVEMLLSIRASTGIPVRAMITKAATAVFSMIRI